MAGISSKASGKLENKKKYAANELQSGEFSDGSGLDFYDFNARSYDHQIGRFHQIDPLSDSGFQEILTPYHYTYNNPILHTDPDGRNPIIVLGRVLWQAYRIYKTVKLAKELAAPTTVIPGKEVVTSMIIVLDANGNAIAIPEAQANKLGLKPGDVFIENVLYSEHTKNARPSSKPTHEAGQARAKQDREGAKGMTQPPRKKPPNHKGPWPPKPSPPKPPLPPTTPPPTTPPATKS